MPNFNYDKTLSVSAYSPSSIYFLKSTGSDSFFSEKYQRNNEILQ